MTRAVLDWPERPSIKRTDWGRRRIWRAQDYMITTAADGKFVCWYLYMRADPVDNRDYTGWQPIGERRTRAAAERCCREHYLLRKD